MRASATNSSHNHPMEWHVYRIFGYSEDLLTRWRESGAEVCVPVQQVDRRITRHSKRTREVSVPVLPGYALATSSVSGRAPGVPEVLRSRVRPIFFGSRPAVLSRRDLIQFDRMLEEVRFREQQRNLPYADRPKLNAGDIVEVMGHVLTENGSAEFVEFRGDHAVVRMRLFDSVREISVPYGRLCKAAA